MDKIICVGMSKTGTTTIDKCFEILGYKNLHWGQRATMTYVESGPEALREEYLDRYEAFSDYPWNLMYEYFDKNYNCKFIMTTRSDSERWFQSFKNHIKTIGHFRTGRLVYGFEDPECDRQKMLNFYWRHNGRVREYFKGRDNFIEMCWENGDGWEKLCKFLDRPIPVSEFPHENKGIYIKEETAL